ncbi:MAG: PAS domain-containing protein, partial [Oceanospirillum sp.]|nr:PAS domain-containing protein [Oceanospirillum sp.]
MNSNKWNQVFRQAPMGMFILSLDGTVIDCNPAAHGFWGDELCDHAAPDIPGLLNTSLDELIDLFSDPEQTELSQTIHLNTPELVAHHPYILKCANPTAWLTVNIAPIRDDQGTLSDL